MHADTSAVDLTETRPRAIPRSYYIVAVIALLWNGVGVAQYLFQAMSEPEALGQTAAQIEFYSNMPGWATSAFAVAVFAGLAGSIMLLIRHSQAVPLFTVSLLAVFVQNAHSLSQGAVKIFGIGGLVLPAVVIVIGIALLGFSRNAYAKGWLR